MKKMWLKKTLSVMLAASMVLSLSACGDKTEENGNNKGDQGQSDSGSTASGAAHYFRADYLGTLPEQFKKNGDKVVFIGDGNDDAEAMREADVSIASGVTHYPSKSVLSVADYLVFSEEALCRQLNQLL